MKKPVWHIVSRPVADLRPWPDNPRIIKEKPFMGYDKFGDIKIGKKNNIDFLHKIKATIKFKSQ